MSHYSYSRLKTYNTCPQKYKRIYIDGEKETSTIHSIIGNIVHEIICKYFTYMKDNKLREDYPEAREITAKIFFEGKLNPQYYPEIENLVYNYISNIQIDDNSKTIGLEVKLGIDKKYEEIGFKSEDVYFRAILDKIDQTDKTIIITDHKTGFRIEPDFFQMQVYAWILSKLLPEQTHFKTKIHYIRYNQIFEKTYTIEDLKKIEFIIENMITKIENDKDFIPTPSYSGCSNCWSAEKCPVKDSRLNWCRMPDQAQKVGTDIIMLETQLKMKKQLLQDYISAFGPVKVNNETFEFRGKSLRHKSDNNISKDSKKMDWNKPVIKSKITEGEKVMSKPIPIIDEKLSVPSEDKLVCNKCLENINQIEKLFIKEKDIWNTCKNPRCYEGLITNIIKTMLDIFKLNPIEIDPKINFKSIIIYIIMMIIGGLLLIYAK